MKEQINYWELSPKIQEIPNQIRTMEIGRGGDG